VASLRDLLEARTALPADFSADGEHLLVRSDLTGTMQLYRVGRDSRELEPLTDLPEPVDGRYVPGTDRILLQMDEGGNERAQLYLLDVGPITAPTSLVYEPDFLHETPVCTRSGTALAYACNRRNGVDFDVFVRDLGSGEERCLYDNGGYLWTGGFSPDGRLLAVLKAGELTGDNDLYLVDVETGELVEDFAHEGDAVYGEPMWLPDGSTFLFATSQDRETTALARYELASRSWRYVLESEWDLTCSVDWAGRNLVVEANEDGYSRLELRDPRTVELRSEIPLPGRGVVNMPIQSADGRFLAFQFTSPLEPGDVWLYDVDAGRTTRVTQSPHSFSQDELVEPELHRFSSFDSERVPVFLYLPRSESPAPVVVTVHGGPEAQARPKWDPLTQYFVSSGYAVAAPNVRGSTGYGKRYEHLDDIRLRLDSVRDLAALHDWLGETGRVDAERTALIGGSYGGYMVLAGLAFEPDRWAAGIDVVGISNLVTFLENTSPYRRAVREREYGSLDGDRDFLLQASPISRIDDVRAPLFIIHGANDPRVPLGEAEQIHRALSERGVRSELLVYPDEGHGLAKLPNKLDAYPKAVAFLEEMLG
jgi:dipeptidyl aminopeptidase/acylaminoacyl peptidase